MERPERPEDDADAAEIAAWMEQDFWSGIADALRDGEEQGGPGE